MAVQDNVLVLSATTLKDTVHRAVDTNPLAICAVALKQRTDPGANSGYDTLWADSSDDLHWRKNASDLALTQGSGTEFNYAMIPLGTGLTTSGTDIVPDYGATGLTTIQPDDTTDYGGGKPARVDHKHAIVCAAAGDITDSAQEGSSTSFARADHDHTYGANSIDDLAIDWGTGTNEVSAVDVPIADALSIWTTDTIENALDQLGGKYLAMMSVYTGYNPVNAQDWDEVDTEVDSAATTDTARTAFNAGKGVFVDASGAYGSPTPTLPSPTQVTSIGADGAIMLRDSDGNPIDDASGNEVYGVLYWNTTDSKFYIAFFSDVSGSQTAYTVTGSPTNWDFYFAEVFYLVDIPAVAIIRGGVSDVASAAGDITGVTAGDGLTGGGTSGTVTVTVGAGTGITVNTNDVAIDLASNLSITGDWNYSGGTLGLPQSSSATEADIWYVTATDKLRFRTAAGDANIWDSNDLDASSAQYSVLVANASAGWIEDSGFKIISGAVTTGSWTATAVGATYGGTGQTAYTVGDILYANTTTTLTKLGVGSDGDVLTLASGVPSWAAGGTTVPASTAQYSILVANASSGWAEDTGFKVNAGVVSTGGWGADLIGQTYGGTGQDSSSWTGVPYFSAAGTWDKTAGIAAGDVPYGSATNTLTLLAKGTQFQVFRMNTGATVPEWGDAEPKAGGTGIDTSGSTGVPYISSGTWATETALDETRGGTGITSYVTGTIIYASGTNILAKLAAGAEGYVLTMGATVPVWGAASGMITGFNAGTGGVTQYRFVRLESATAAIHATNATAVGSAVLGVANTTETVTNPMQIRTVGTITASVVASAGAIAVGDILYLKTAGQVTTPGDLTIGTDYVVPVAVAAAILASGGGTVAALIGPLPAFNVTDP